MNKAINHETSNQSSNGIMRKFHRETIFFEFFTWIFLVLHLFIALKQLILLILRKANKHHNLLMDQAFFGKTSQLLEFFCKKSFKFSVLDEAYKKSFYGGVSR